MSNPYSKPTTLVTSPMVSQAGFEQVMAQKLDPSITITQNRTTITYGGPGEIISLVTPQLNFVEFQSYASWLQIGYDDGPIQLQPLCDVCRTLGLEKANEREEAKYTVGNWDDIALKAETEMDKCCPFCVLLDFLGGGYGIEGGPASIEWKSVGGFFVVGFGGANLAFLNEETAKTPYGCAREIQPNIDPALIKKWITLCESHHEETCAPTKSIIKTSQNDAGIKILRVIDTEELCIVEATPGLRYLALSYVWGPVIPSIRLQRDTVAELGTKGALRDLQHRIPKTIRDAMDLTQLIGERYLWVDSLCLIQDDSDDMLDGIAHMDLVYQGATLTIIAAHGVDANAGLPGLHAGSREMGQIIVQVLPETSMTLTIGVYDVMTGLLPQWSETNDYVHQSRGWTLQELVLSHRTLIFTEHVIYFRCRTNCWSEDTIYDNFPQAINNVLHSGSKISFVNDNEPHPISAFNEQLFRYADRRLTKESDTIHGFAGITRFMALRLGSSTLEGLFTTCFDISILCWDSMGGTGPLGPGRRHGFPSWSWAGWYGLRDGYGRFCTSAKDVNAWLQNMTYVVWYKRSPGTAKLVLVWDPSSQLKIGDLGDQHIGYKSGPESSGLDPYGRTGNSFSVDPDFRVKPDDVTDNEDSARSQAILREMASRNYHFLDFFAFVVSFPGLDDPTPAKIVSILDSDREMCGGIRLDSPELMKDVQGPYEFVLLSKMDRYDKFLNDTTTYERPFYWAMLIQWQGEEKVVAERRGIGYLFVDCIERAVPPVKVWREIVLA